MWIIILPCAAVQTCTVTERDYTQKFLQRASCPAGVISLNAVGVKNTKCDLRCQTGFYNTNAAAATGLISLQCSPDMFRLNKPPGASNINAIHCFSELSN